MQMHPDLFHSPYLGLLKATSSFAQLLGHQVVPIMQEVPVAVDIENSPYGVFELNPLYLSGEQIMALTRYLISPEQETPRAIAEGVAIVLAGFDIPAHHFQACTVAHGRSFNWAKAESARRTDPS
jgi:hypothetical protein